MRDAHRRFPFFFFTATPPSVIYTLSLHDALPIYLRIRRGAGHRVGHQPAVLDEPVGILGGAGDLEVRRVPRVDGRPEDRKSTRLNSSHPSISYAVFCLKKKRNIEGRKGTRKIEVS